MATKIYLLSFLVVVITTALTSVSCHYCPSYCDENDELQSAKYCLDPPYCCGWEHYLFCCNNQTMDVTDIYQDVYMCAHSSFWWMFNWRVVMGLLAIVTVVLLCSAFCCKICDRIHRSRRSNEDDVLTISENVMAPDEPVRPDIFNPSSPFAFIPPEYDSLPKDPPKYDDVYAMGAGSYNQGFMLEEEGRGRDVHATTAVAAGQVHADKTTPGPEDPPPQYTQQPTTSSN